MLQEDSNGESSFEIIDKKNNHFVSNTEKTESLGTLSSVSSAYSLPSPSIVNLPTGNLLSNVAPPSSLPDFTLWPSSTSAGTITNITPSITSQMVFTQPQTITSPLIGDQFPNTQFSAAIPPSKGIPHGPITQSTDTQGDNLSGGGFMGLVKEAFSSGVLSKMAEKAKSSVDSIITTLDPQMSEYIYSGGDTEVTVTSENESEVSAVRDAFHLVFGKAWVNGIQLNLPLKKSQAVGFEEGFKNAEEKIGYSLKYRNTLTVAIENILFQQSNNWYDLTLLVLRDAEKQITVNTFSQATPILDNLIKKIDNEKPDYRTLSIEEKLALYFQSKPSWQQDISGVTRKEVIFLAAKTLVGLYRSRISSIK